MTSSPWLDACQSAVLSVTRRSRRNQWMTRLMDVRERPRVIGTRGPGCGPGIPHLARSPKSATGKGESSRLRPAGSFQTYLWSRSPIAIKVTEKFGLHIAPRASLGPSKDSQCYFTPSRCLGVVRGMPPGPLRDIARHAERECSMGFQPVSGLYVGAFSQIWRFSQRCIQTIKRLKLLAHRRGNARNARSE